MQRPAQVRQVVASPIDIMNHISSGTVTIPFADIEGSTKLARKAGFMIKQVRLEEQFDRLERLIAEGQVDNSAMDNPRRNQCQVNQ